MNLYLHNTLTREKQRFEPLDATRVTLYVCGPTVYSHPHIGNARPAVVFDLLYRVLRRLYDGDVVYARNITDVDDKINAAAAASGLPISDIASRYTDAYHSDLAELNVLPPSVEPRATEHIGAIIDMIRRLIDAGFAYAAQEHVLFRVARFTDYGALSGRDPEELLAGARVEVAPYKQDPGDFVLWKPSSEDLPGWDSPWGRGRPGWHIECSAMIESCLGTTIDIHGGGHDLIFPHHENEIAQSRCAHQGAPLARYWLHNGFVNVEQQKMSKSVGNVLLVRDLLTEAPGEAIRYALLAGHYRGPLDWTAEGLAQAKRSLDRLYGTLRDLTDSEGDAGDVPAPFIAALADDLNTPRAFAELFAVAKTAHQTDDPGAKRHLKGQLLLMGETMGLLQSNPETWFAGGTTDLETGDIERLIAERERARADRDFARADTIRDELASHGIAIEDRPDGTRWRKTG